MSDSYGYKILTLLKRPTSLIAGIIALFCFIFLVTRVVLPATARMTHGFIGYYAASLLVVQGKFGPQAYDNDWFADWVRRVSQKPIGEALAPGLPTEALIAVPFTFWPPQLARANWLWVNLFLLIIGLGFLIAALYQTDRPTQPVWWLILIAFAFVFPPVAANFYLGQAYILLLCLFALALFGLVSRREWLVGAALGLAFILKTSGLPLWLLLLLYPNWKILAWGAATILLVVIISLPWLGLTIWWLYPWVAFDVAGGPVLSVTAYQTTTSFFNHLFRFDPVWNPHPLADLPTLAAALTMLVTVGATLITIWRGLGGFSPLLFAALSTLSVIIFPAAEEYQYTLLLIPIFILVDHLHRNPPARGFLSAEWLWLAVALGWLLAPIPYKDFSSGPAWLALVAYPRLFGGWLIWGLLIRQMGQLPHLRQVTVIPAPLN